MTAGHAVVLLAASKGCCAPQGSHCGGQPSNPLSWCGKESSHACITAWPCPSCPSHPKNVLPESPRGTRCCRLSAILSAQGGTSFTEQPGCRLAAVGGLTPAQGHLTLHVPPQRFVRVPLTPLPAASCPAGAAWCQFGPAGARCQMHKEGLSATGNTEGVDFRPGKRGHKGPGPGRGMRGCAPAPCQWRLCSEYKGRRGSGASGAVKGSRAQGAPWGPCSLASLLPHPKCCLRPHQTLALACCEGLSQAVPEWCWLSSMVATGLPLAALKCGAPA